MSTTYELWMLHHADLHPLGIIPAAGYSHGERIPGYEYFSYSPIVNGIGYWTLGLSGDFDISAIQRDTRFVVWRTAPNDTRKLDFAGLTRYIEKNAQGGSLRFVTSGPCYNDVLRRRIIAHYASTPYTSKSGYADDVMKELVRENLGSEAETDRDITSLAPNLILNPGFETAGGGAPDIWASWTEDTAAGGTLANTTICHGGVSACLATTGAAAGNTCFVRQDMAVTPLRSYRLTFWTRGDYTNAGRYGVYDVTGAADIIATTSTGITGGTFQQVDVTFQTPAACVSVRIYLRDPAVALGWAIFDDVKLIDVTAGEYNQFAVETDTSAGTAISKSCAWDNLLKSLQEIADDSATTLATAVYFGVVPIFGGSGMEFRTRIQQWGADHRHPEGTDGPVIFSLDYGNLIDPIRNINYNDEATYVYAGGQGTDETRELQTAEDTARSRASPLNRCETFYNASQSKTAAAVLADAQAALRNGRPRRLFSAKTSDLGHWVYGRDFGHGDYVTAVFDGEAINCHVNGVTVNVKDDEDVQILLREETTA